MPESGTRNTSQSVSGTSSEICPARWGRRKSIIVTNTSAAAVVTIGKEISLSSQVQESDPCSRRSHGQKDQIT